MVAPLNPRASAAGGALHVAILGCRGIPARYGGFETFAEAIATRLVKLGFRVTVYAEADGQAVRETSYKEVVVRHVPRPRLGAGSALLYDCLALWDARRRYDLVYLLGYGAAWAAWLPRLWGTPVWINPDGLEWARAKWPWPVRVYLRAMEWLATRTASRLIADSEAIAQRFRRLYGDRIRCETIAYGAVAPRPEDLQPAILARWQLEPGRYALVVARPEPENHILEIVQGYLAHTGDWPLVVVGDFSRPNRYQRRILQLSTARVRFLGAIHDRNVLDTLRYYAAVYLHGHSVGGTNPSLLEALACGNLIIAHDNPYNREVAGDEALYFRTPADVAASLNRIVARRTAAVGRASPRAAARPLPLKYDWDWIARRYAALIMTDCQRGKEKSDA